LANLFQSQFMNVFLLNKKIPASIEHITTVKKKKKKKAIGGN